MQSSKIINNNIATEPKIIITGKKFNEYASEQAQQLREKIFFSGIANDCNDKNIIGTIKKNNIVENSNFYNTLATATSSELVKIFIDLIYKLISIDSFYCDSKHLSKLNNIIARITNETINQDITLRFNCCCYWLYALVNKLESLRYQHQNNVIPDIISQECIAIRLDECLANLNSCWDGISTRFAHEYEVLNAIGQGLTGKILLVKKGLFQKLASNFMYSLIKYKNYGIPKSEEIHIYNLLHKTVAQKFGFIDITDKFIPKNFPVSFIKEFKELAILEISPASITLALVEQLYESLTSCLAKINLQNWLTEPKTESELTVNLNSLDIEFFEPTNMLFNAKQQKLSINSILDIAEINDELVYSLVSSQERLHLWVAKNLMPNTEKLFITNAYSDQDQSYFSIASIDYLFFWVIKQDSYQKESQINLATDNHTTLNLSHIKQLDFVNFSEVNVNNNLCLAQYPHNIITSIALVTQALRQTHNPLIILDFFINNKILQKLQQVPLLRQKLDFILVDKLSNNDFKRRFINNIVDYYLTIYSYIISKNEISFFIKHKIFFHIFPRIIQTHLNIDECFNITAKEETNFIISYLKKLDLVELNKIVNPNNSRQIFQKALNCYEENLINKLLLTGNCNDCINIISNNARKETALALATRRSNLKLLNLLLQFDGIKVTGKEFYNCFKILYSKPTYDAFVEYIKKNLHKYSKSQLIELLQARATNGDVAILASLRKRELFIKYIRFIFSLKELNFADKMFIVNHINKLVYANYYSYILFDKFLKNYIKNMLKLDTIFEILQSKDINGDTALGSSIRANNWFILELYINNIFSSDLFTAEQKNEILLAKNINNIPILFSLMQSECTANTVQKYIERILTSNQLDINQKFRLMLREVDSLDDDSLLNMKMHYPPDNINFYISTIAEAEIFSKKQELDIIHRLFH